ncbi:glycosyltransferase [Halopseudomonas bauzanensis]|nr:glycosyltransferase [Halopseudomonas bauzanensis]
MAFVSKSDQNYVDIRDLTWEYLSDRRFVAGLAKKFFRMRVRAKIKKFDLVSVTNQTEKEYVTSRLEVGAQKVVYLPNGIGLSQFDMLGAVPSASKLTDIIKVYYIGNVGLAQDLSTLVAAAQKLPHFQFFVVGEGTDFVRVRDQAISAKLQNMTFTGRVSWEDVPAYYADADILYAQLTSDYSGAMPSKLYEYLASGKYIIYGGEKQAISVLKDFDHNLVVPPSDSPALVDALLEVEKSGAWRDFSKNNRELISKLYIREHTAMNLVNRVIDL